MPVLDQHYRDMEFDPFHVMKQVPGMFETWCIGSIIKYSLRAGTKVGEPAADDLAKAAHYAQLLLKDLPF